MKPILLILLCSISCFSQDITTFAKDTPLMDIVTQLFDGRLNKATGECEWQPNTGERFQFGAGKGQVLYTVIDTTFVYHTGYTQELIVATSTYSKDGRGQREDCHICAPALSLITMEDAPEARHYVVADFSKYVSAFGGWGEPGSLSLIEIAEFVPLVVIDWGYTGQGATYSYKTMYYKGLPVLDIITHIDNEGATDEADERYSFDTTMAVDRDKGRLIFTKTGTEPDGKGKIIKVNQATTYRFDTDNITFDKVCD